MDAAAVYETHLGSRLERDYSLTADGLSLNTRAGRVPVPHPAGNGTFFDGSWQFSTAHLVYRHGRRWFFHVPMTREGTPIALAGIRNVAGVDVVINFLVTASDSQGPTLFVLGRTVKAQRRLKSMGQRENR